jgi:hypothetical protein
MHHAHLGFAFALKEKICHLFFLSLRTEIDQTCCRQRQNGFCERRALTETDGTIPPLISASNQVITTA